MGVHGVNGAASGTKPASGCGVWGDSQDGYGVYGSSKNSFAGQFEGNVAVSGTIITTAAVTGSLSANTLNVSGTITTTDVILQGADCAEDFDLGHAGQIEPGSVVVFDAEGAIGQSSEPYNKRVAGVISGAGKYRPGVILGRDGSSRGGKAPVALMGRVYCKVDASYSPIVVGDMLTTSPTLGFAMKASDPSRAFGAVIGKALASVPDGRGLIPILVALQ
jgi:hypothetical protein